MGFARGGQAMGRYVRKLGAGLSGILQFKGRMALHDFWPYAITLVLVLYGLGTLCGVWVYFEMLQRFGMTAWDGDATFTDAQVQDVLAFFEDVFRLAIPYAAVSMALHVVLLAAAIVRRLHDTGRTGAWVLMPLPFGLYGLYVMDRLLTSVPQLIRAEGQDPVVFAFMAEITWAACAALLWLGALFVLIVFLCGRGQPQQNRYGPPPIPIQ